MLCRIDDLKDKEVICTTDGTRLGYVCDVEIDCLNAKISSLVVYEKSKFFNLFGKQENFVILWENISIIGEDTILVNFKPPYKKKKAGGILSAFFEIS